MSLKRRNRIAWILLLIAAISWALGQRLINSDIYGNGFESTIASGTTITVTAPTRSPTANASAHYPSTMLPTRDTSPISGNTADTQRSADRFWGFILCIAACIAAAIAVFFLRQRSALLGPDSAVILVGLVGMFQRNPIAGYYAIDIWVYGLLTFFVLVSSRELWGWARSRFSLSWCAVRRLASRCPTPQLTLLVYAGWIVLAFTIPWILAGFYSPAHYSLTYAAAAACGILGTLCLWQYGTDLHHFQKQLLNFRDGLPISVKDGTFTGDEQHLQDIQTQHEEAVRTAVTSERFKVELISNVSHDLRTPLTSILGYSELLQKETLSPEGQKQLRRLHQKAGYMNDLVESLFELTKVSSGVIESKKEEIDLVRLLEQTIGLFDDQLTVAGLFVRRHYDTDTLPIITDGARMHQVFANLLGNAIKYAMPGTRIYLEVKEKANGCLVRMVNTASYEMDFKPEEIMQRFARGDKARSTKGSGLGLAIAQTYTESVGGKFHIAVDGDQFSAIVELPNF